MAYATVDVEMATVSGDFWQLLALGSQKGACLSAAACMNKIWCAHRVVLHCCSDATWNNISKAKEERRELPVFTTEYVRYRNGSLWSNCVTTVRCSVIFPGNSHISNMQLHLFKFSVHLGPKYTFTHFLLLLVVQRALVFISTSLRDCALEEIDPLKSAD